MSHGALTLVQSRPAPLRSNHYSKQNNWLERMCQTFQVLFLFVLRFIVFFAYVGIENGSFYRISHISPNRRVKIYAIGYDEYPHGKVK